MPATLPGPAPLPGNVPPEKPEFLTTDEVADRLRLCDSSARRMCRSGVLPAVRIGRLWRVRREQFEAYLIALAGPTP